MPKITIPTSTIMEIFPESLELKNLPRKKKKALKIKLGLKTVELIIELLENEIKQ
jgi:hypothetical protein